MPSVIKPKRVALYARVSKDKQMSDNQMLELRAFVERAGWVVVNEYVDEAISGSKGRDKRPAFDKMIKDATRKEFHTVAAWSVDRLGRSLQDLVNFLGDIQASKVGLYLHQQGLDTDTPTGKAMFQMCGVFAEFERAITIERINSGIARSRIKGTKSGKPHGRPANLANPEPYIRKLRAEGLGMLKIAKQLSIGTSTVQRVLAPS